MRQSGLGKQYFILFHKKILLFGLQVNKCQKRLEFLRKIRRNPATRI